MTVIKQDDLIQSVADALQFISYYHPVDFIQAMHEAYLREESPAARDSMAQILINSRMCITNKLFSNNFYIIYFLTKELLFEKNNLL